MAVAGVRDAALFGQEIHLMTGEAGRIVPKLRQALEGGGFRVGTLERITPSLEDVFVSLIEARDRAEGAQKEFLG
jgi:ABC-2 type transport system ATP-binding protein